MEVRGEGAAVIPMCNDYIDAVSNKVGSYFKDPQDQTTNGFTAIRCWLT